MHLRARCSKPAAPRHLTQWADARKLLKVYENVLIALEDQASRSELFDELGQSYAKRSFESLSKWLRKDGFLFNDGHLVSVTGAQSSGIVKKVPVASPFRSKTQRKCAIGMDFRQSLLQGSGSIFAAQSFGDR